MATEKVKFKTCIDTGKKYKDNPVIEIELEDGRKGSAFDSLFLGLPIGNEVEIDIKPAPDYKGEKKYYFNIPGKGTGEKKGFPAKDWTLEKRKISLECSISAIKLIWNEQKFSSENIIALAETFFTYLNKK